MSINFTRPRPVLTSAGITGGIQGLVLVLGFLGYSDQATKLDGQTQTIVAVIIGALSLGGNLLHALHAQAKVTPLASPQSADGTPLIPAPLPVASSPSGSPLAADIDAAIAQASAVHPANPTD